MQGFCRLNSMDPNDRHHDPAARGGEATAPSAAESGLKPVSAPSRRRYTWKDYLRIGAGIVMLCLGVAGLVLPILQGVLFLLVSVALLAPYFGPARRIQAWSQRRFPAVHRAADAMVERMMKRGRRE